MESKVSLRDDKIKDEETKENICGNITKENRRFPLDSGYAWFVFVGAFVGNIIYGGLILGPPLFLVEWYQAYPKSSKFSLGAILGGMALAKSLSGFFCGTLLRKYGNQKIHSIGTAITALGLASMFCSNHLITLYVAFIFVGLGIGLITTTPVVIVYEYFDKYKALASGLTMTGNPLSSIIVLGILRVSIDCYGWQGAMLIYSGIVMQGFVCATLFLPNEVLGTKSNDLLVNSANIENHNDIIKSSNTKLNHNTKERGCTQHLFQNCLILQNIKFVLFVIVEIFFRLTFDIIYKLSAPRAVSKGINKFKATSLISCVGIASLCGRISFSAVANLHKFRPISLYICTTAMLTVLTLLSNFASKSFPANAITNCLLGLNIGGALTLVPLILVDIAGSDRLKDSFSVITSIANIFRLFIMPVSGLIYDATEDFNICFYLGSCNCLLSTGFAIAVATLLKKNEK